jgi:hypothetical protein
MQLRSQARDILPPGNVSNRPGAEDQLIPRDQLSADVVKQIYQRDVLPLQVASPRQIAPLDLPQVIQQQAKCGLKNGSGGRMAIELS